MTFYILIKDYIVPGNQGRYDFLYTWIIVQYSWKLGYTWILVYLQKGTQSLETRVHMTFYMLTKRVHSPWKLDKLNQIGLSFTQSVHMSQCLFVYLSRCMYVFFSLCYSFFPFIFPLFCHLSFFSPFLCFYFDFFVLSFSVQALSIFFLFLYFHLFLSLSTFISHSFSLYFLLSLYPPIYLSPYIRLNNKYMRIMQKYSDFWNWYLHKEIKYRWKFHWERE